MTRQRQLTSVLVCALLGWTVPARADVVTDWNDLASQAAVRAAAAGRPGQVLFLDFAIVHAAIHDAVQAIEGRFDPYRVKIRRAEGSLSSATAKAAHDVLAHLYPAQVDVLKAAYDGYLLANGLSEDDPGVAVGARAAAGIIAFRANDGSFPPNPTPFTGSEKIGAWRPTPPGFLPMAVPWLGNVRPFTLKRPSQFVKNGPPPLGSRRYARDFNEVKSLGREEPLSDRTPAQTDLARFWSDNYAIQWNRALRSVAATYVNTIGDSARLLALANLSAADAIITAWNAKNRFANWRPITAIQEGDRDGNRRTAGDATWLPLITTPNYPDHSSGANNVSAAYTRALALFFGTEEVTFSMTTLVPATIEKTRTFTRFSDASDEVVVARIYEGIHFRFADEEGQRQGRRIARWAFRHFLRPVGHRQDDDDDEEDDE